jgi:hypothetical protein
MYESREAPFPFARVVLIETSSVLSPGVAEENAGATGLASIGAMQRTKMTDAATSDVRAICGGRLTKDRGIGSARTIGPRMSLPAFRGPRPRQLESGPARRPLSRRE